MIYVGVFCVSTFFYWVSNKTENQWKRSFFWSISVMIPVLLAALRGINVGTDIKTYVLPSFNLAKSVNSLLDFIKINFYVTDILFNVLVYASAKIFHSLQFLLGSIQLIISIPVYLSIDKMLKKDQRCIALITYYFVFYCMGLNLMRQTIAVVIGMLALIFFTQSKKKLCIICFLLAMGFHKSAIFILILILVYWINKKFYKKWLPYLCACSIVVVILFYQQIMIMVIKSLPQFFGSYLNYMSMKQNNWPMADFTLYLCSMLIGVFLLKKQDYFQHFLGLMSICAIAGIIISKSMTVAGRIMLYCNYYIIFTMANAKKIIRNTKFNNIIINLLIIILVMGYWFIQYIVLKNNEAYPYTFQG